MRSHIDLQLRSLCANVTLFFHIRGGFIADDGFKHGTVHFQDMLVEGFAFWVSHFVCLCFWVKYCEDIFMR